MASYKTTRSTKRSLIVTPGASASGYTPHNKRSGRTGTGSCIVWSQDEDINLVAYILKKNYMSTWPTTKNLNFWEEAALFLNEKCGVKRTSGACRARVIMKLSKLYSSPTDAERNLQVTAGKISKSLFPEAAPELAQFSPISSMINPGVDSIRLKCQDTLFEQILKLTLSEQFDLVGDVVHLIAEKVYGIDIPPDFVRMSLEEHAIKKPSNALESENNVTCISDDDGVNGSDDISSSECLTERSCNSSDAEEDKTITGTTCQQKVHTVIFKVIGCTKEQGYQEALRKARDSMQSGVDVPVPEPSNPFNTNAVAFMCFIDNKWHRIGYVVNEILHHIHEAINNNLIISVKFAWIKFISDWMHSGPGYFAGVALTKYGEWPKIVVSKRSTR